MIEKTSKGIVATGTTDESRVYVACLACYNEGKLRGNTYNADQLETMSSWLPSLVDDDGNQVLCGVRHHNEWAIHEYDGNISRLSIGEHPDIDMLIEVMNFVDENGGRGIAAYIITEDIMNDFDLSDVENTLDNMEEYDDPADWAYETCKDSGYEYLVDGWHPAQYIDWSRVAEDMLMDYHTYQYGEVTYIVRAE